MAADNISKLQRVPLREVWKHEAYDFTQWLQDNLDVLNGILNIDLVSADREQAAGAFSVDLVAETDNGDTVVIENQLEKSNHDHLGKLITYFSALTAKIGIWIVSDPRPEHVGAITWLNEATDAGFYLIKVEAVRIGDSPPAPLLTLIVGPSEDSTIYEQKKDLAERDELRLRWWRKVVSHPDAKLHSHLKPGTHSWIGTSSGVNGLAFNYTVKKDESGAELYIDRGKGSETENKSIFDKLEAERDSIESQMGTKLSWERLNDSRASRIKVSIKGGARAPEEEWPGIQEKAVQAMVKLVEALAPRIKKLGI